MNVFDYAMKMEQDGRSLYLELARKVTVEGIRTIFQMLADDEQKHYETFKALKSQPRLAIMDESTTLEQTKNIFEKMRHQTKELETMEVGLSAYLKAMAIEADSVKLYEDAAEKESNSDVKRVLLRIAREEQKHYNILENLYLFANAPNQYLAWREFSNTDSFHQFGRDVDG